MILLTVGTQGPFDRLVRTVDEWLTDRPDTAAFGQIGVSRYVPINMQWKEHLTPAEFHDRITRCEVIVAHAGIGTILTALEAGRSIVIMPRRAALGEHRNDHQVDTAARFAGHTGVAVAADEQELVRILDERRHAPPNTISPIAPEPMLAQLRRFIASAPRRRRR